MRRLLQFCLITALSVAGGNLARAQNTVPNGDIENNCGANAGGCPTFAPGCVPGWSISHGTPQLGTTGGIIGPSEFVLWNQISSGTPTGEGVYATLTAPTPTRGSYELCFYYRVVSGAGNVVARFTTGLTPGGGVTCGEPIPVPSAQLVAYNSAGVTGGWQHVVVSVSSLTAYNQLNVYPVSNSATTAFWIELDGFEVRHCGTSLVATPSTLPFPSGLYERGGTILSTSSSSPGTVTANPAVNTTFRSSISVTLEPDFVATPNSGIFFLAEIGPCGCAPVAARLAQAGSPALTAKDYHRDDLLHDLSTKWAVNLHPNPAIGSTTLHSNIPLRQVRVLDLSGKVLLIQVVPDQTLAVELELSALPAGIYLVEAQASGDQKLTTKVVKQ